MDLKSRLLDAIAHLEGQRVVTLEELLASSCLQHLRHWLDGADVQHPSRRILSQRMALGVAGMIQEYLVGCYRDRFQPGSDWGLGNEVVSYFIGTLDGTPVDFALVPHEEFSIALPPQWAATAAAFKAARLSGVEAHRVILITMDQDKQDWTCHEVQGDFEGAARLVEVLLSALESKPGSADQRVCRACEYKGSCPVEGQGAYAAYMVQPHLSVVPELKVIGELDAHLWKLNEVPNGRKKCVIHPSEISTNDCDRFIAYGLQGQQEQEKVDPKLRRIFDTGHAIHEIIQRALKYAYEDFLPEVKAVDLSLHIEGSCDGSIESIGAGVEIKSIGSKGFQGLTKAKSEHEKQATIYGVRLELDRIYYIYVCKADLDVACYEVRVDRRVWHKIATRATNIVKMVEADELPPKLVNKDYQCRGCKYGWLCRPDLAGNTAQRGFR